jgi:hypothetical protein
MHSHHQMTLGCRNHCAGGASRTSTRFAQFRQLSIRYGAEVSTPGKMRIAVAQTEVTTDPSANGTAIRAAMRHAADQGARLVHLGEGSLSGYAGAAKPHYAGWRID